MDATNIYENDFLDILFNGKNKDYGAYDLRRSQDRRLRNAIMGTASLALVVIGVYVVSNNLMAEDIHKHGLVIKELPPIGDVFIADTPPVTMPPPTSPDIPPRSSSSITFITPYNRVQDVFDSPLSLIECIDNRIVSDISMNETDVSDVFTETIGCFLQPPPPQCFNDSTVFCFIKVMPSFPGGEDALVKFLQKNIRYPDMAIEKGIEGQINVRFIIDREGNINGIKIAGNHIGGGLEEEGMRVVKLMPKWKPGKLEESDVESVNVQYNLPISFHLQ